MKVARDLQTRPNAASSRANGEISMEKYANPPIIDATIEARFAPSLPERVLKQLIDEAKRRYAQMDEQVDIQFTVGTDAAPSVSQSFAGARFLSEDGTDLLTLQKDALRVSRLPPYGGWTALKSRIDEELGYLKKLAPDRRFTRLGVRYINRIDVPNSGEGQFEVDSFFTFFPDRPAVLKGGPVGGYVVSLAACPVGNYLVNVNTGTAPAQLIDHGAIVVDVDAYIEADMDFRSLNDRIEGVREVKNAVFESLITDQARQLFR